MVKNLKNLIVEEILERKKVSEPIDRYIKIPVYFFDHTEDIEWLESTKG